MINIMLVDDDAFFRTTFSSMINWYDNNCNLICQAENGQQAIELLNKNRIDLIFTDMSMPLLDGIQLIDYISKYHTEIKYVALSSYDDFSYVKQSLTHGALDYILKHMLTKNDLHRIINSFKETHSKSQLNHMEIKEKNDIVNLRSSFLIELLEGTYSTTEDIAALFKATSLPNISNDILLFSTELLDYDNYINKHNNRNKSNQIIQTILNIMQSILEKLGDGIVFLNQKTRHIYSIISSDSFKDVHFAENTAALYIKQVRSSINNYLNLECRMVSAPICRSIQNIYHSYLYILKELKEPFPIQTTLHHNPVSLPQFYIRELKHYLYMEDFELVKGSIIFYYDDARKKKCSLPKFSSLSIAFYKIYLKLKAQTDTCENTTSNIEDTMISRIYNLKNDSEMQSFILDIFKNLHLKIKENEKKKYSVLVYNSTRMIHNQYHDSTLSLNTIANTIHVNPSYLSRTFKSEKEMGIMDYLNMYRVTRSADFLLTTNLTVKEIALNCGFDNYNYFFKVFTKIYKFNSKNI